MYGDGVRVGPGGEEPFAGGIEIDIAREGPADRLDLHDLERGPSFGSLVDGDRVVPAVRGIHIGSCGMNEDFGGGVEALGCLGLFAEAGSGGNEGGRATRRVPGKDADREAQFIEKINEFTVI